MNPPFTSNEKRGVKFSRDVQSAMRDRERDIRDLLSKRDQLAGESIDQNSIRTFFTPLADRLLADRFGTLAQVIPVTALSSASGLPERRLLLDRFDIDYVITTHDPKRVNFSENTEITESLLVCRRRQDVRRRAKFVNLKRMPATVEEAISCVNAIELREPDPHFDEIIEWDHKRLEKDDWHACLFVSSFLAEKASELVDVGPAGQAVRGIFKKASELADVGPAGRRIQDAFDRRTDKSQMFALWNHKSRLRTTMEAEPDYMISAKVGKKDYAEQLWNQASQLVIANRIEPKNVRTTACYTLRPVLGSAWVPISSHDRKESTLKAWCVWLNSSWTIISLLGGRAKKLTYPSYSLMQLRSQLLPNPDLASLEDLARVYDDLRNRRLEPWRSTDTCTVRREIDDACASLLDLDKDEAKEIREHIVREPTVNPEAS